MQKSFDRLLLLNWIFSCQRTEKRRFEDGHSSRFSMFKIILYLRVIKLDDVTFTDRRKNHCVGISFGYTEIQLLLFIVG